MKIGVSSYSYSKLTGSGKMSLVDVIRKAKETGFNAIEFVEFTAPEGQTRQSYAAYLKKVCADEGLEVCNYAVWADFLNGSSGDWKREAERLREEIEIAYILGSPVMRHDASWGFKPEYKGKKGFDDALPVLAEGCRRVAEYAAQAGIRTMTENHGYFAQDSERIEKLVNAVGHENFGVLLDMGNLLCVDEDPAEGAGRLAPYIFHVHAKDFHVKPGTSPDPGEGWFRSRGGNYLRGAIIGHGEVPVVQVLNSIKRQGYDGPVSIEFEGLEDPAEGIAIGLENLKRYLAMAGI